jgi:phosphate:Na+ symporter
MDELKIALNLLGALGVFLFGMKVMSEALQKVAGDRLKGWLRKITANRFSGVVTGFLVTCLVQSSSATTVMVVSFVNARLIDLVQAIGVIMGANIGTTITGWLVALLGFKVKLTAFALPAVGIGFFMTFLKGARRVQWGEVLLGFGLLFLGLSLLKSSVPKPGQESLVWIKSMADMGFMSLVLFVLIGTALTIVLQSSSATMTLTLTLTASGWIPYEIAAAMILGENIGTTITANLAAIGTNATARQAARAHALFNVIGVIWALALFKVLLLPMVDALIAGDPVAAVNNIETDPDAKGVVTAHLAAFHTAFNIINTLLLLPFVYKIAALVQTWVSEEAVAKRTRYISTAMVDTPEMQVEMARQEMHHMAEIVHKMYGEAAGVLFEPAKKRGAVVERVREYEETIDELENEIIALLALTARAATSADAARQVGEMSQNTHRLERMADHCEKLLEIAIRHHELEAPDRMGPGTMEELQAMSDLVAESVAHLMSYLDGKGSLKQANEIEKRVNKMRDNLREQHLRRVIAGEADLVPQLVFLDAIHVLEEVGDRCVGIIRRAEETRLM